MQLGTVLTGILHGPIASFAKRTDTFQEALNGKVLEFFQTRTVVNLSGRSDLVNEDLSGKLKLAAEDAYDKHVGDKHLTVDPMGLYGVIRSEAPASIPINLDRSDCRGANLEDCQIRSAEDAELIGARANSGTRLPKNLADKLTVSDGFLIERLDDPLT